MRPFPVLLTGLFLLTTLGCDQLLKREGEGKQSPPAPASAPVPVAKAPSAVPSSAPPPAASSAQPVAPPAAEAGPVLQLTPGAEAAGLAVNQLRVVPAPILAASVAPLPSTSAAKPRLNAAKTPVWHEVTVYAVFRGPFARRIELRAHGVDRGEQGRAELGRSEREAALSQPGDSSRYVTFRFDPRMPLDQVRTFDVYVDPDPQASPEAPPAKASAKPPSPPEPQFIRPIRPDLVPKDP